MGDFMERAGKTFAGYLCRSCDRPVAKGDPIRYDIDAVDGEGVIARVWCATCFDALEHAKHSAFLEAYQIVRGAMDQAAVAETLLFKAQLHARAGSL